MVTELQTGLPLDLAAHHKVMNAVLETTQDSEDGHFCSTFDGGCGFTTLQKLMHFLRTVNLFFSLLLFFAK